MIPVTPQWPDTFLDDAAEISEADALRGFRDVSHDIKTKGPLFRMLTEARAIARQAIMALIDADHNDAKLIFSLQSDVRRYRDLVGFARRAIEAGIAASEMDVGEQRGVVRDLTDNAYSD
jgi:hypothetical protein